MYMTKVMGKKCNSNGIAILNNKIVQTNYGTYIFFGLFINKYHDKYT